MITAREDFSCNQVLDSTHYYALMQLGLVSVWVPILVGVLGIVGVVAGQVVNAWRENQRWRRERDHENYVHWRTRRLEAYTEFFAACDDWEAALTSAEEDAKNAAGEQSVSEKVRELADVTRRGLALIDLLGTPPVIEAAAAAVERLAYWQVVITNGKASTSVVNFGDQATDAVGEFQKAAREDLKLGPSFGDPAQ